MRVARVTSVCSRRTSHIRLHPRRKRRHQHCAQVGRRLCRPTWGQAPSLDHVHDPYSSLCMLVRPLESVRLARCSLLAARCPALQQGTKLGQTARRSQTVYAMCPSVCSKQTPPLHGVDYKEKRLLQISARGQMKV